MALSATETHSLETKTMAPDHCEVPPRSTASYRDDVRFHLKLSAVRVHICALMLYDISHCIYVHKQENSAC